MINVSGTHIVYGLIGEMLSKHEIVATDKKYKFATLRNCSYKPFGRNVTTLYFDVDIELLLNFNAAFVSRSALIENTRDAAFSCSLLNRVVARSKTDGDFCIFFFFFFEDDDDDELTDGLDSTSGTVITVCVVSSLVAIVVVFDGFESTTTPLKIISYFFSVDLDVRTRNEREREIKLKFSLSLSLFETKPKERTKPSSRKPISNARIPLLFFLAKTLFSRQRERETRRKEADREKRCAKRSLAF
jgi:hypothetical protein